MVSTTLPLSPLRSDVENVDEPEEELEDVDEEVDEDELFAAL